MKSSLDIIYMHMSHYVEILWNVKYVSEGINLMHNQINIAFARFTNKNLNIKKYIYSISGLCMFIFTVTESPGGNIMQ